MSAPQKELLQQLMVSALVVPDPGEDATPADPRIPQQNGGAGGAGTGGRVGGRGGSRRRRSWHGGRVAQVVQVTVESDGADRESGGGPVDPFERPQPGVRRDVGGWGGVRAPGQVQRGDEPPPQRAEQADRAIGLLAGGPQPGDHTADGCRWYARQVSRLGQADAHRIQRGHRLRQGIVPACQGEPR